MLENGGGTVYLGPDPERTKGALFLIYQRVMQRVAEAERQDEEMGETAPELGGSRAVSVDGGLTVEH